MSCTLCLIDELWHLYTVFSKILINYVEFINIALYQYQYSHLTAFDVNISIMS